MKNIVFENKLTAKERNALPDKMFGLPEDRSYPLTDEVHVRKAVQFFKYCPPSKRTVLAANINKRAKALGMKMNISKENPFYKLADKSIIQEVSMSEDELLTENFYVTDFPSSLPKILHDTIEKLKAAPMSDFGKVIEIEKYLITDLIPFLEQTFKKDIENGLHSINPFKIINNIMLFKYKEFFSYNYFIRDDKKRYFNDVFYSIVDDICYIIRHRILSGNEDITKEIKMFDDLIKNFNCNRFFIQRKIKELLFDLCIEAIVNSRIKDDKRGEQLNKYVSELIKFDSRYNIRLIYNLENSIVNSPLVIIDKVIKSSNANFSNIENYLKTLQNELKNQINIILMSDNIAWNSLNLFNEDKTFYLNEISHINRSIYDIIDFLEGSLEPAVIKWYDKDYTFDLTPIEILSFSKLKEYINKIYVSKDKYSNPIYFGIKDDKLYLLLRDKSTGELVMLTLYDRVDLNVCKELIKNEKPTIKLPIIVVTFKPMDNSVAPLTEGISIDKNGDVKFIISPKKSFMDEYAENHKLLVENYKNKNYEGMKRNLAFLFVLINTIEREVHSGKPDKKKDHEWFENARKARAFAINDFKTYLKYIQQAEKDFDFTKYYQEGEFDKKVVNIPVDSVIGIKKLFTAIMMG